MSSRYLLVGLFSSVYLFLIDFQLNFNRFSVNFKNKQFVSILTVAKTHFYILQLSVSLNYIFEFSDCFCQRFSKRFGRFSNLQTSGQVYCWLAANWLYIYPHSIVQLTYA